MTAFIKQNTELNSVILYLNGWNSTITYRATILDFSQNANRCLKWAISILHVEGGGICRGTVNRSSHFIEGPWTRRHRRPTPSVREAQRVDVHRHDRAPALFLHGQHPRPVIEAMGRKVRGMDLGAEYPARLPVQKPPRPEVLAALLLGDVVRHVALEISLTPEV